MDLKTILQTPNIATVLNELELNEIGDLAVKGYKSDDESRAEWKERNKKGMDLAMQLGGKKDYPHENAANVMYPLISIASIQFASRAMPNLVPGWDIVRGKVIGKDEGGAKADKAKRVETHMNYQLNEEMEEWEEETDRLMTVLPILGCCFKETYWSKNLGRNVSLYSSPNDIVMHYMAKSMATVPRITKRYNLYPNEIIERQRFGIFIDFDMGQPSEKKDENQDEIVVDEYTPHLFLQQHTWLDLDNDGYKEPYILNIHYDTKKIVRIIPRFKEKDITWNGNQVQRIVARRHYTKYSFLPSPDGSIYDWGFGSLLGPINHTVNTTINQLLDAGTQNNSQGGFLGNNISLGRGKASGPIRLKRNEWMPVNFSGDDLRKNIVPLNEFLREPSGVLFNLLGFMVTAGEKLSSVTDLMMGEQTVHNEPATTSMERIRQGSRVFASIHKRLHRAFGQEFKLLYQLNAEHLDPNYYYRILDEGAEQQVMQSDYDKDSCDIIPVSSPDEISNSEKMMKAQTLFGMKGMGFNDKEIDKRFIEALQIPDPSSILDAPEPPPDPKLVLESEALDIKRSELEFEMMKYGFEMAEVQSKTILNLAKAESEEIGPQLEEYKTQLNALVTMAGNQQKAREQKVASNATNQK